MKVTRIRRSRHLAQVRPGDLRASLAVRVTASRREQTLLAVHSVPAARGLVWVTVTEMEEAA